jgi:hypothetical protein
MWAGFHSFMMGGFECSSHRRRDGRRLDLIAATAHDRHAREDYFQLGGYGIRTVRDGVRWHLVEPVMSKREWSSLDTMLDAARATGTQVIWDLLHYGWPDWTNPFDADFVEAFAAFAEAAARRIGPGGHYCPINEISFLAWAGGEVACLNPFVNGRGEELKQALCKAAIAATRRIRSVDPDAVIVACEPLIAVHPVDESEEARDRADGWNRAQYDAVDCLLGRRYPEFGGSETGLNAIGLNYYPQNQWLDLRPDDDLVAENRLPLSTLLVAAGRHFELPVFIAETGCENDDRAPWLRMVLSECNAAAAVGHPVLGVCLYPILDHPGWDDDRVCRNGLLCGYSMPPRPAHEPLLAVVRGRLGARDQIEEDMTMSVSLTATFDTPRDADLAVERLVQECGLDRATISVAARGDRNSVGVRPDGADAGPELRDDAPLDGGIAVSITCTDDAALERVRETLDVLGPTDELTLAPATA